MAILNKFVILIICGLGSLHAAAPFVTNVAVSQRANSKLVDIRYDVTAETPTVRVVLEISSNAGATYLVPVGTATGALGDRVPIGTGRTIVWNAGVDWNGNFTPQARLRLLADDGRNLGGDMMLIPASSQAAGPDLAMANGAAFHLGKYEVTKVLWDHVRTWGLANGYSDLGEGAGKNANHPVQMINWFDLVKWCNARSEKEGLVPVYSVNGAVMKTGATEPEANWSASGYRLPTAAEWERAARGGVSGQRFPWGDTISHSNANFGNGGSSTDEVGATGYHPAYATGAGAYTSPVGSFPANGYGLHDMAGNVWEWCWDKFGELASLAVVNDAPSSGTISKRVVRGGSWFSIPDDCRISSSVMNTVEPFNDFGFRVAQNSATGGIAGVSDAVIDTRDWALADTNGDGSGDAIKLNLAPRIGDQLHLDFRELGATGTFKLVGKLPAGMTFNAATGVLKGKLSGKPGTSALRIQNLQGKKVVRDIPLILSVAAFPSALTGTWQALLEGANGLPQGLVTTTLTAPGKWTATLDVAGSSRIRRAVGNFQIDPAADTATISMRFTAAPGLTARVLTLKVSGPNALASGSHSQGVLRGFRLARGAELPAAARSFNLVIDQSEHNGKLTPADKGRATLSMVKNGTITLRGKLGDGQAVRGVLRLGATGQALFWLKPYRNLTYGVGGVLAFHETGAVRVTALTQTDGKLWWHRVVDSAVRSDVVNFTLLPAVGGR